MRKYTHEQAEQVIQSGEADAVAFGQLFIANPDLPARFAEILHSIRPIPPPSLRQVRTATRTILS